MIPILARNVQETKDKTSASMQGKNTGPRSQETKDKISAAKKGKNTGPQSEEHKAKRSASMRKPKSKCICPHCGQLGGSNNMKRWHFDNCKIFLKNEVAPRKCHSIILHQFF